MRVERENDNGFYQILWHAQSLNITSDGTAYDLFLWCDHEPTKDELRGAFIEDYGCEKDAPVVDEWVESVSVWSVWAEEIE